MRKLSEEDKPLDLTLNLTEYARILWRRKLFIIIPLLVCGTITFIGVRFLEPVYQSSSIIRMENSEFLSHEVDRFVMEDNPARARQDIETLSIIRAEVLNSKFLDDVIRIYKLDQIPAVLTAAVLEQESSYPHLTVQDIAHRMLWAMLQEKIRIEIAGPDMFLISVYDTNPKVCYSLAQTITDMFIDLQERKQLRGLQEASEFSDEQLAIYKEQLQKSERALSRIKTELTQQQFNENPVTDQNIRAAETFQTHVDMAVTEREGITNRIRQNTLSIIGFLPSSEKIWGDQRLQDLENILMNHRETELIIELSGEVETSSRRIRNTENILEAEGDLQRYLSELMLREYPSYQSEQRSLFVEYFLQQSILRSLQEKQSRLRSYILSFHKNLELIPQMELEEARLQQEVNSNRELYHSFLRAKTSAQISKAVAGMKLGFIIDVIETAKEPLEPIRPHKMKILLMSLMFGGFVGVVFLIVNEYTNTAFNRVEEVEKFLDLKVLGVIPSFDKKEFWTKFASKAAAIWLVVILLITAASISGFYLYGQNLKKSNLNIDTRQAAVVE